MMNLKPEQIKRANEAMTRMVERLRQKQIISEALKEIHDSDCEYQKERAELERRYHAELIKLEEKYLVKFLKEHKESGL